MSGHSGRERDPVKNADYWRGRFAILENSAHKQADEYLQTLEDIYREAEQSVRRDIESWYQRFATNNKVTLAEARKMLATGQLEEFRWTAEQYVKAAQRADLSPEWIKKLENASTRFHVSRLEAIQLQIGQQMELLYGNQVDGIDDLLKDVVSGGYTRGAFEIQKGIGLGWDFTALNQKKLETLLSKPWTTDGRTFRDRCWANKADLVDTVNKELIQGMLRGDPPSKIITAIQKQFGTFRYKARRLVHTETSYFNAVSKTQMYRDLGVNQTEIVETLDSCTCSICQPLDGTVVSLSQYEPGVTVPPFHPNCRGTTCPHYDDMDGERATRTADGEVYYVPANMTFTQWKKAFVDGVKDGLTVATAGAIIKLTKQEQRALNEYISSGSYKINIALREGRLLSDEEKELIEYLDAALKKMPVYEGTVYRSITDFGIDDINAFWANYIPGKTIRFPAYTSSGTEVYDDSFSIQYVIQSKSGRDVRKFNPKEFEILFPRDSEFRIVKVEEGTIYMEELE